MGPVASGRVGVRRSPPMYEYKCPGCDQVLRSAQPAPAGKAIKCKACGTSFTPKAQAPRAGTAAPVARAKAAATPAAPAARDQAGDNDVIPYVVIKEED